MLCTHYQSNSVSSEAFRSVRTALYFNTHGVGHQVIQVTSPNVSDGKSTLAANLAVSIAQSGKRTIMIDGDCRRPRIHKIFNVPADTGLGDGHRAVRPTWRRPSGRLSIPNLSVLPCGPRPANPAELLTSPRFKELLDIIRSQYDFVIIDTPPLLVVTDPCVVAPRADGVILAIRVTKNGRPFAERAKEILASLGANVLGVVVNGLGSPAGAASTATATTSTSTATATPTGTATPTPTSTRTTKRPATTTPRPRRRRAAPKHAAGGRVK